MKRLTAINIWEKAVVSKKFEEWRMRQLAGEYPYVFVDDVCLKRGWNDGEVRDVRVLTALGIDDRGYREIVGVAEKSAGNGGSWSGFLKQLRERGLKGVRLIVSDNSTELREAAGDIFPGAKRQSCVARWYEDALASCPAAHARDATIMLKAIHAQEDREAALEKAALVAEKLRKLELHATAKFVENSVEETLSYMDFPYEHRNRLRINGGLDRIMREIRRRTRGVGNFPDDHSAMMSIVAMLRRISATQLGNRQYMNVDKLFGPEGKQASERRHYQLAAEK